MIDPLSAYLTYSTAKRWVPYAIGGVAGLALGGFIAWAAWVWQGKEIADLKVQRDAYKLSIDNPDDGYKVRVAGMAKALAMQAAELTKLAKDAAESQTAALELIDQANARADSTERKLAQLRKQAHDAPEADKPRPLSPAARAGLEWLRCRAKAPADPGACGGASGL